MKLLACILAFTLLAGVLHAQQQERLVWPNPPQQARIEFIFSITSPADIGVEKSFLRKAWDWLIGASQEASFLVKPLGVAVDPAGRIYVTDTGARCIHIFDRKEKRYETISESEGGLLRSPVAIAIAKDGRIYVTDSERREVIVYDEERDVKFVIKDYFQRPTGISIYSNKLYVVDTALNEILVFDLNGRLLFRFGKRGIKTGEFNFPVFLAAADHLYLADAMNFRIQVLDGSGSVINAFGEVGNVQGRFANPKGVAVDSDGHIYVADALFDAFQIFDRTGKLLLVVGRSGQRQGEFLMPAGIWIDKENRVYVVDSLNRRIQVFQYLGEKK